MKDYYIGIDCGTDSVGIACTDEEYNLLYAKRRDLWAVRLFDTAATAKDRRLKRTARRRLLRRRARIDWLQAEFEAIIDELFFARLNNSGFVYEDKDDRLQSPYSLFSDSGYTDKEFYKEFPTIFHLRRALILGEKKYDPRLYYLALHHIVKYRGHFLFEGKLSEVRDVRRLFDKLNEIAENVFEEAPIIFESELSAQFKEIAVADGNRKTNCENARKLFDADDKRKKEALKMIFGLKGNPSTLFGKEGTDYEKSFSFKEIDENAFLAYADTLGADFEYLAAMREIYNYIVFEKILSGGSCISEVMVTKYYEKHKSDLKRLKKFVIDNYPHDVYLKIFKSQAEPHNYVAYVGYTKVGKKKVNVKKCKNREDFYKFLKKTLSEDNLSDEAKNELKEITADIESDNFLPKILNADNGVFPHQINLDELDAILKNLVRDYPQFGEKDESGLTAAERIRKIFLFKIPYFVGPLNTHHSELGGNSWAVRKSEGKITPWNIEEMIDYAASNEKFMRRMTNKCSYLFGENVLPKCSIIYQKYDVLNQLNNLKINEKPISEQLKRDIFKDLFCTRKIVRDKDIKQYLADKGHFPASEQGNIVLSGKDGDFKASMSSYIALKRILGDFVDKRPDICEQIILWHTLNTDKNIVEKLISDNYGKFPEIEANKKQLKGLSFKDFGRLSEKFLCGIHGGVDFDTGEALSILDVLYRTNKNLNQILYDEKYNFLGLIGEANGSSEEEITIETLEDMGLSPAVRRGVWQSMKMIDEYVSVLGQAPKKIFVEVTRTDLKNEKGKRTESRKEKLRELYKSAKDVEKFINELDKKTDADLRQERLYLYFKQLGKCAYSGKEIDLSDLSKDVYDVDHIIPRSFVKDDSIDNKVLVLRACNKEKTDIYPVPEKFRNMKSEWEKWLRMGLISSKKYSLLTRTAPLTEDDYREFLNRQLVFTGQTAKAVAELLRLKYEKSGTKIVYSKAGNIDDFKQKYDIVKCRETNDLHHARDAYLNIVVGNVYDTKFSNREIFYRDKNGRQREYNLKKLFDEDIEGAWSAANTLAIVKKILAKPSMAVTRYAFLGKGSFYDETVYGKNEKSIDAPRKGKLPYSDTNKYGGFKSLDTAYFAVVVSRDKKGKEIKTIERIPVLIDYLAKNNDKAVIEYLRGKVGLTAPQVLHKLKLKTLVEIGGSPVWLAGVTGNRILLHNAAQWFTDSETDRYVNALTKLTSWKDNNKLDEEELNKSEFIMNTNRFDKVSLVINAEGNIALYDKITTQLKKPIYAGLGSMQSFIKNVEQSREKFLSLSVFNQAKVLLQCIRVLKCNPETADLSLVKQDGSVCGILRISKNITSLDICAIHTSPCGLTQRKVKL